MCDWKLEDHDIYGDLTGDELDTDLIQIEILGKCNDKVEVIDIATNMIEADFMANKYQMAFGDEWEIWYE